MLKLDSTLKIHHFPIVSPNSFFDASTQEEPVIAKAVYPSAFPNTVARSVDF